jgi:hypothetical protein
MPPDLRVEHPKVTLPLLAHECRCSRTFKGSVSPSALSTAPPYLVEAFCSGPLPHHVGRLVGASLEPRWSLAGPSLDPRWSLAGASLEPRWSVAGALEPRCEGSWNGRPRTAPAESPMPRRRLAAGPRTQ